MTLFNRIMLFAAILLTLTLASCATVTPEQKYARIMDYVRINNRPDFVRDALLNLQPARGMNASDIQLLYGRPVRVNQSAHGQQAVYRRICQYSRTLFQDNIYVYFENGVVTDWQIMGCI